MPVAETGDEANVLKKHVLAPLGQRFPMRGFVWLLEMHKLLEGNFSIAAPGDGHL